MVEMTSPAKTPQNQWCQCAHTGSTWSVASLTEAPTTRQCSLRTQLGSYNNHRSGRHSSTWMLSLDCVFVCFSVDISINGIPNVHHKHRLQRVAPLMEIYFTIVQIASLGLNHFKDSGMYIYITIFSYGPLQIINVWWFN